MTEPVLVLKLGRSEALSPHRQGIVGCMQPVCTFTEPHLGLQMPPSQRLRMNHCAAASSVGYSLMNWLSEMPLRNDLPCAFCFCLAIYSCYGKTPNISRDKRN